MQLIFYFLTSIEIRESDNVKPRSGEHLLPLTTAPPSGQSWDFGILISQVGIFLYDIYEAYHPKKNWNYLYVTYFVQEINLTICQNYKL